MVAIIGGWGPTAPGVELYDIGAGTFTRDIALQVPRSAHSALVLSCPGGSPCSYGGKVLVVGGWKTTAPGAAFDAEIYDPVLHMSILSGTMAVERGLFNAVQLDNGKVVVGSGYQLTGEQTSIVELFDPASGAFVTAMDLAVPRGAVPAVHLADDSVVYVGGWSPSAAAWGSADSVNPADLLATGTVNAPYTAVIASAGTAPFAFTIVDGALPPGILLNTATGALSGAPTSAGTFRAVVRIADSSTPAQLTLRIVVIAVTP
jgi:hypothetical protein